MSERLITLGGALLALFILLALFGPEPAEAPVSLPTSSDSGPEGLSALHGWLEAGGIPVRSLRQPYESLWLEGALPPAGNLLVTALPHRNFSRSADRDRLTEWLAQGNSVLLLAALSDWPEWAERGGSEGAIEFLSDLGFDLTPPEAERKGRAGDDEDPPEEQEPPAPERPALTPPRKEPLELAPVAGHPLLAGVERVAAEWRTSEQRHWRMSGAGPARAALVLLRDGASEPAFWQARVGDRGTLLLSRQAALFDNSHLGQADNARLAANLVSAAVGPGGAVIFDDYHQGLSDLYDPDAFFKDPRLWHTIAFLAGLWLVYLLGHTNRLRPPGGRGRRAMTLADEVRSLGGLIARRVRHDAVARRLFTHFFNELRAARGRTRNGRPAWELLADDPRVSPAAIERLKALHAAAEARRGVDLTELQDWLHRTRKMLR